MSNKIRHTGCRIGRLLAVMAILLGGRATAQQRGGKPVAVEVVKPVRRALVRELRMPANLVADEQVDLFSKASGYVEHIEVDIGSRVQKGDVLVKISVPEMADELRQADAVLSAARAGVVALRAKATQARRMIDIAQAEVSQYTARHELETINLERTRKLHEGNAIPEQALDEARSAHAVTQAELQIARARIAGAEAEAQAVDADVEVAKSQVTVGQARLARLKTLMAYASIRAPFDGVVTVRNVDHGTFVRSAVEGTTLALLTIAKTDRIRVVLDLPESDASHVRVGTDVEIDVRALATPSFTGKITRMAGALRPDTRTLRAEIDVANPDGTFTPGMYAQVVVTLGSNANSIVIPSKAVRVHNKKTVVFVATNGRAESIPIKIGYDDGIWAEIVTGLSGDESIITSSAGAITAGAAIRSASANPGT